MGSKILSVLVIVIVVVLIGASGYYLFTSYFDEGEPSINSYNINLYTFNANLDLINVNYNPVNSNESWLTYNSFLSIRNDQTMNIVFKYPQNFGLEFRNSPHVLNIFEGTDDVEQKLNNSRIFINYYEASEFGAEYVEEIQNAVDITVNDKDAKKYLAIKKGDPVEDRPDWLGLEHTIMEILTEDRVFTIDFYSQLDEVTIETFLESISFVNN